jgi:hypothetical protein
MDRMVTGQCSAKLSGTSRYCVYGPASHRPEGLVEPCIGLSILGLEQLSAQIATFDCTRPALFATTIWIGAVGAAHGGRALGVVRAAEWPKQAIPLIAAPEIAFT